MVSYKDLGLVNTRDMFAKAIKGGYAIPAFNFNNMEQMQAIVAACVEASSPVILQVSSGARKYANQTLLRYMAQGAVEYAKELGKNIPIVLHLDHGNSFELCKSCIDMSHGANKFKPEQCTRNAEGILVPPPLRFDILKEIEKQIPGFPIVLHGSSSVPQEYVKIINTHGGALKDAVGIPEEQLREAAKSAVCKINIDSDGRLAMTAAIRQIFVDQPAEFDPRKYLGPARDELKKLYKHKCENVLGSAGKA